MIALYILTYYMYSQQKYNPFNNQTQQEIILLIL